MKIRSRLVLGIHGKVIRVDNYLKIIRLGVLDRSARHPSQKKWLRARSEAPARVVHIGGIWHTAPNPPR